MSNIKSSPGDYVAHDLRNRVAILSGFANIGVTDVEDVMERKAAEEFEQAYNRLERVLYEEGSFDDALFDDMKSAGPFYTQQVVENAESTVFCLEAVKRILDEESSGEEVSELVEPVGEYGMVEYDESIADEELKSPFGAMISTMICDYLKHAYSEDKSAEMFAKASDREDFIEIYIGDTGPGIESEELESTGTGSDIKHQALTQNDAKLATYTREKIEELNTEKLPYTDEIGALFKIRVPKN